MAKRSKQSRQERRARERALVKRQQSQLQQQSGGYPGVRAPTGGFLVRGQQQAWTSPTLPPQVLAEYTQVVPNAGERFFNYMEKEQDHRHKNQTALIKQSDRAQTFVFLLSGTSIIAAAWCAVQGQALGLGIAAAGVLPLVQAVWQRHKQAKIEQRAMSANLEDEPHRE